MRTRTRRPGSIAFFSVLMLAAWPRVAAAQPALNQHCIVTVLNRTVKVNPDGTWVLPNIPANSGRVKARATCIENGVARFGESDYFTVPKNGTVTPPRIIMGTVSPIPTILSLGPAPITFTSVGQTVQLSVIATYPNGSTKDVSTPATGTDYTISNTAIATINGNGLVTAVASGTVVIQAINEGTPGMATATVKLSTTDTDGDGIPDDVEIASGMDPRNRVDAIEDFDRDNLTNLEEYLAGTDLRNPDSDADGLLDGDEVHTWHTNPLIADTDGDLIPDGVEVLTGSNPLNRNSYDLKKATARSTLNPSSFLLTTNPLLHGDVSVQLSWQVTLIDNKTRIDLTTDPRTTVASNNLAACNFGVEPARVFAGQPGDCIIQFTNGTLSVSVPGTVKGFTPNALSFVNIPGFANNVDVSGDLAYVAAGSAGLQIVDVSDRTAPHIVASRALPGNANDVVVSGHLAYVAAGSAGLQIVDITKPLAPTIAGSLAIGVAGNVAWDVVVKDNRAYVADGTGGLVILDVSAPSSPVRLGSMALTGTTKGVDVDPVRMIAVVARGLNGVSVINVANPASPALLGGVSGGGIDIRDVVISGTFAFLADYEKSFTSLDITTPSAPLIVASTPLLTGGRLVDVAVLGDIAVGADVLFVNGVPMFDVSDPSTPTPRVILDFKKFRDDNGTGIALDSSFVYLTATIGKDLQENGTNTNLTRLYIGQYRSDDQTPPTVTIQSPAAGDSVIEGATLPVTINATDNFAVASVSVLVDHQVVATSSSAPYQLLLNVPVGATSMTLTAQAVDFAGNVGTSTDVTLTVTRDTEKPVVQITAPTAPLTVAEGSVIEETVNASDNVGVTRVEFLLNDMIVATKTAAPYEAFITLPVGPTAFRFGARAFDPAGNAGVASETVVNVTSDPPPVVRITSPASGISVREGELVTADVEWSDNVAVLSARFDVLVNGVPVESDLRTLHQYEFGVPIGVDSISLVASAVDNLGQVGKSPLIVLNVLPEPGPTVRIVSPTGDEPIAGGRTIPVVVEASDDVAIKSVSIDGIGTLHDPPYRFLVTIPESQLAAIINLRAVAVDNVGKSAAADVNVTIAPDPLTTVHGVVTVDNPILSVNGADVTVSASGLTAEFFRSHDALTSLPDLTGLAPDFVKLVTTPNPAATYFDPFGLRFVTSWSDGDPNTIVRLRGTLKVPAAGTYTFSLRSYAAGRLTVNGSRLVDFPNVDGSEFHYDSVSIVLPAGDVPIEAIGMALSEGIDIQIQYAPEGGTLQAIPMEQLTPAYSPYHGVTDENGNFAIEGVPTGLGDLTASATLTGGGHLLTGQSAKTPPVPEGTTDVGSILVSSLQHYVSKAVAFAEIPGYANDVAVRGGHAFVAAGAAGLQMVAISDAHRPYVQSWLDLPGNANGVFAGAYVYVAAGIAGLHLVSVRDFGTLTLDGSVSTGGEAWDVVVYGDRAYVANGTSGLAIVDVTVGEPPRLIGSISIPGIAKKVDVDEARHLAVVVGSAGVTIVDVLDPAAMQALGTLLLNNARDVSMKSHDVALITTGSNLVAADISTPSAPQVLPELPGAFGNLQVWEFIDLPATAVAAGATESHVVATIADVHDPGNSQVVNTVDFSPLDAVLRGDDLTPPSNVTGVGTDGTFVYATVTSGAPVENGTTGTTYLYIGQYLVPEDTSGAAPFSYFTNVSPDEPVGQIRDSVIDVGISVIDDVAIATVKVFVNGQLEATVETPSSRQWQDDFNLPIPVGATSVTLRVETTDVGGNTSSQTITVPVATFIPSASVNFSMPSNIGGIGTDGSSVWVTLPDNTDGFGVSKIRRPDGQYGFLTTAAGHHRSTFITVDGQQNAWVSNVDNNTVVGIAPDGGSLRTVAVTAPGNLLYENGHIWAVSGTLSVVKIDAATGTVMGTFSTGGLNPGAMTFDGANVWIVNRLQNTVAKIRASDGALLGSFATGANVNGITFDGTNIWTANRDDGTVSKINSSTGATVAVIPVGSNPTGIAFDGLYLWVVNFDGGVGSKIRPSDGTILGTFYTPLQATAIVVADRHLYVVGSGRNVWGY